MRPLARRDISGSRPILGEVLDFMSVLWQVDHALQRTSKRMEASLGVTGPQRLVVRILGRFPGLPAGHLTELLHLHPSTLSGILKRLERQRLVQRRPDPRDRRRVLLSLTSKGRMFDVQTEATVESAIRRALARSDHRAVDAARAVLVSIVQALGEDEAGPDAVPTDHRQEATTLRRTCPGG